MDVSMPVSSGIAVQPTFIADEMLRLLVHAETLPLASERYATSAL